MTKKASIILILLIACVLIIAALTKPDDKKIKIYVIDELWGGRVPNMYGAPDFYEQFMNVTTRDIDIDDWIFFKRIKYTIHDTATTIGYAAFGKVILRK